MWNYGVPTLKEWENESIKESIKIKHRVSESFGISGTNSGVTQVSRYASDLTRSIGLCQGLEISYGEWLALHQIPAGILHAWNHY